MALVQTEPKKIYLWTNEVKWVFYWTTKVRPSIKPITTPWIYWNETAWLISLSGDGSTRYTIADKNLWATSTDTSSSASYWYYFQRWNCYGFPNSWSVSSSTTRVNINSYWPNNYYSSSTFIKQYDRMNDYSSVANRSNLRWYTTGTNEAKKWPCDTWFHIPTPTEVSNVLSVRTSLGLTASNFRQCLKLPVTQYRNYENASATRGMPEYWTCQYKDANKAWYAFDTNFNSTQNTPFISYWLPIRPRANTATQPDETWTRLDA